MIDQHDKSLISIESSNKLDDTAVRGIDQWLNQS